MNLVGLVFLSLKCVTMEDRIYLSFCTSYMHHYDGPKLESGYGCLLVKLFGF